MWAQFCSSNNFITNDRSIYLKGALPHSDELLNWELVNQALLRDDMYFECLNDKTQRKFAIDEFKPFWSCTAQQDKATIYEHIMNGKTFVITSFSKSHNAVKSFCGEVETNFDINCDAHVYGSTEASPSFNIHYDSFSNFIIQCDGETEWTVYKNRASDLWQPMNSNFNEDELEVDSHVTMTPGDVLYIPSRCLHRANPKGKRLSLSIPCAPRSLNGQPYDRTIYKIPID